MPADLYLDGAGRPVQVSQAVRVSGHGDRGEARRRPLQPAGRPSPPRLPARSPPAERAARRPAVPCRNHPSARMTWCTPRSNILALVAIAGGRRRRARAGSAGPSRWCSIVVGIGDLVHPARARGRADPATSCSSACCRRCCTRPRSAPRWSTSRPTGARSAAVGRARRVLDRRGRAGGVVGDARHLAGRRLRARARWSRRRTRWRPPRSPAGSACRGASCRSSRARAWSTTRPRWSR